MLYYVSLLFGFYDAALHVNFDTGFAQIVFVDFQGNFRLKLEYRSVVAVFFAYP